MIMLYTVEYKKYTHSNDIDWMKMPISDGKSLRSFAVRFIYLMLID